MNCCDNCHYVPDTALAALAQRAELSVPLLLRAVTEVGNDAGAVREWRGRQAAAGALGDVADCRRCQRLVVV
jgi:hypothetical protein